MDGRRRRMVQYDFADGFELAADADRVFAAIADTEDWPRWWKGLRSHVLFPGTEDAEGVSAAVGRVQRFWVRAPLGYPIEVVGEFLPTSRPRTLRARMRGHLDGDGEIVVTPVGEGRARIDYALSVRLTATWMRLIDPIARPLFVWGHNHVVGTALDGLAGKLAVDSPRDARGRG